MSRFKDHSAYIDATPEQFRAALLNLRAALAKALPDAEELIRYNMPGFGIGNSIIAGYAAFSHQCGLYVQKSAVAEMAKDIAAAGLRATKTGVTFSLQKPICEDLAMKLAIASRRALGI